jgi:hypothetical protein
MLPLPLTLIWLCSIVWTRVEAQQCRLTVPFRDASNGGLGHAGPSITDTSTAVSPSSTTGSNANAQQTQFAYGTNPIRGVNL